MSTHLSETTWEGDVSLGTGSRTTADLSSPFTLNRIRSFSAPAKTLRLFKILTALGALVGLVGLAFSPDRVWGSVLMCSVYLLGLALGALFFIATQYLSGAGWSTVIRRVPEAVQALIPWGLLGIAALLIFHPSLFKWYAPSEPLEGFKSWWLDYRFVILRFVIYGVIWIGFARLIVGQSRAQDYDSDPVHYRRNIGLSALYVVLFAFTCWLSTVDWLMSLEPEWFSTIYGVYNFSGVFVSGVAVVVIVVAWLVEEGALRGLANENHMQDLGKILLGFTTFWAYIWFSEYMLIWYGDIPEETTHYVVRTTGTWGPLFLLNLILNWVIPFFALLPKAYKRSPSVMVKVAAVVLLGRWLDLYLMVFPSISPGNPVIGVWEIGVTVGAVGLCGWVILRALGKAPLIPLKDPFLGESLHNHQ